MFTNNNYNEVSLNNSHKILIIHYNAYDKLTTGQVHIRQYFKTNPLVERIKQSKNHNVIIVVFNRPLVSNEISIISSFLSKDKYSSGSQWVASKEEYQEVIARKKLQVEFDKEPDVTIHFENETQKIICYGNLQFLLKRINPYSLEEDGLTTFIKFKENLNNLSLCKIKAYLENLQIPYQVNSCYSIVQKQDSLPLNLEEIISIDNRLLDCFDYDAIINANNAPAYASAFDLVLFFSSAKAYQFYHHAIDNYICRYFKGAHVPKFPADNIILVSFNIVILNELKLTNLLQYLEKRKIQYVFQNRLVDILKSYGLPTSSLENSVQQSDMTVDNIPNVTTVTSTLWQPVENTGSTNEVEYNPQNGPDF